MVEPLCERAAAFIRLMILLPATRFKRKSAATYVGRWLASDRIENAQAQRDS
jgi:hypothetical protein